MSTESDPPLDPPAEAVRTLGIHVLRLARAVESYNKNHPAEPMETVDSAAPIAVRYAPRPEQQQQRPNVESSAARYDLPMPSFHAAPRRSVFDKLREKRLTLPAATGWGIVAWIAIEVGQAFLSGRLKLW